MTDYSGVPSLYVNLCRSCSANLRNQTAHYVVLERHNGRARYGFVCSECKPKYD